MIKRLLFLLFPFALFTGCIGKHPCANGQLNPAFVGFSMADIDTFVMRAYKPNDNFQHLVDTVLVCNCGARIYTTTNDTTVVFVNDSNADHWINTDFDWQIYIPAKNKTVSISKITNEQTEGSGRSCLKPITSFVQNGQVVVPHFVQTDKFYTAGFRAYIHN